MKTDKRTSNLFIAGGYCLVAIIILFNYLGQAVTKERTTSRPAPVSDEVSGDAPAVEEVPDDVDALIRQLEEEKRVNLEMREMLKMMQSAIGEKTPADVAMAIAPIDTTGVFEIPEVRFNLAEDLERPRSNPFIPGKNPFAPISRNEESGQASLVDTSLVKALRCDPRLPFFISGANSRLKSKYYANF